MGLSSGLDVMAPILRPPILNAAAMRAAEARVIVAGTPSLDLMERAGAAAATAAWRFGLPRAVNILCGAGNNGGDGYVVARHLAALGHDVTVIAATPPRTSDARTTAARWPGPVLAYGAAAPAAGFVDALFGIGAQGEDDRVLTGTGTEDENLHPSRLPRVELRISVRLRGRRSAPRWRPTARSNRPCRRARRAPSR